MERKNRSWKNDEKGSILKTEQCLLPRIVCWPDPTLESLWVLWLGAQGGVLVKTKRVNQENGENVCEPMCNYP